MSSTQEESAILFQDKNIYLLDIPHSIALAQQGRPTPHHSPPESSSGTEKSTHKTLNLISCSPIKEPFPSTEPKKPAALARVLDTIPISERRFHSELILPLVRDALETIKAGFSHDRWCEARAVPSESHDIRALNQHPQKRRRGNDYTCFESTAEDQVSTKNEPPMILSTTSPNNFEALSDLAIVKNPSPDPAIIKVGSWHDETNCPCEYIVPPESSFVLCTLPLFQSEVDRPSTCNYPIPGLPEHQKFNLILMDPPWPNKSVRRSRHYQTHHYSEMDVLTEGLRDILRVHSHEPETEGQRPSEIHPGIPSQNEESVAAIWITNAEKARRAAYEALTGAGFCICEEWIWIKTTWDGQPISALDGVWRKPYEILVVGRKGGYNGNVNANNNSPLFQVDDLTRMSEAVTTRRVIAAVPDLHSRKPSLKSIFENVLFMDGLQEYSALEVFARNLTAGWCAAGNEVLRFNAPHKLENITYPAADTMPKMRFVSDDLIVDRTAKAPMQVLGAGLPRCATSSMQAAMESEHINYRPSMHMAHIAPHVDRSNTVLLAMRESNTERRQKLLHQIFDGFQATSDFPGCAFIDDLMDMYPEAKIVLNLRPGGGSSWEKSIRMLYWAKETSYYVLTFLWKTDRNLHAIWLLYVQSCMRNFGLTEEEVFTEKHYDAHNAWVHAEAAKRGREVLEHEPKDGWEPLCTFLGKETPENEPYPHRNDASEIRMVKWILYTRGIVSWLVVVGTTYGVTRWFNLL
ncbi:unnamed protein product [Penicillium glandicola]